MNSPTGDRADNPRPHESRTLTIELLALDLDTCGRCTGTGANLDAAIATVAEVLREADVEVEVRKTVVTTAAQAEQLRFESSPTIRINGHDIALELRESNCGDCGDLCGCDGQVNCRVWIWQGREHVEAPKALIVDAILRTYGRAWESAPTSKRGFRLPENLRKFFDARARTASQSSGEECCDGSPRRDASANPACCTASEMTLCCDASEKTSCCGATSGSQACGCKG